MAENIKELQELKVQNDEILKQQQAALDALDDLQERGRPNAHLQQTRLGYRKGSYFFLDSTLR